MVNASASGKSIGLTAPQEAIARSRRNRKETIYMKNSIKNFVDNDSGATAIEYALICSLVACAIIASITVLGTKLQNTFNEVSSNLK
jgi:pilus assembly protein Flp/PilA